MDRWKMFDHEAPASVEELTQQEAVKNAKDYLMKKEEERRQAAERDAYDEQYYTEEVERQAQERIHIILSKTEEQFPRFKVRVERNDEILYDKKTGIESHQLGFVVEEEVLPLRDLLERLGFDVWESYE